MIAVLHLYKFIIQKYIVILDEDINSFSDAFKTFFNLIKKFRLFIFLDLLNASLKLFLFQKLPAINVEFLEIKIDS